MASTQAKSAGSLQSSEAFLLFTNAMPQMVWSTRPDGFHDYFNDQWYEFTGVPYGSTDGDGWANMFHVDDQERAWAKWSHSLQTGDPYEVEYRLRHHSGEYRWTLGRARAIKNEDGHIVRWIGTCTDIHEARLSAELNELLTRELSHRIKNIFAVISGLISLSSREFPETKDFAAVLRQRVAALGRAHEFVRPHSAESRPAIGKTTLKGLLSDMFKPYPAVSTGQLVIEGDDLDIDDRGATPVALLFHELATNAMKYGALSEPTGSVSIDIVRSENSATIHWREKAGPIVAGAPTRTGFGTRLANVSIADQLGGDIQWNWLREGLTVTVELQQNRLVRESGAATGTG